MGAIDDGRKVLQDFLAPELREIKARLDALEKQIEGVDRRAEVRHQEVMLAIGRVIDYTEVRERLARLESRETVHQ
jgi:tetrahydromethanopterin S-methyltransferase subunit G